MESGTYRELHHRGIYWGLILVLLGFFGFIPKLVGYIVLIIYLIRIDNHNFRKAAIYTIPLIIIAVIQFSLILSPVFDESWDSFLNGIPLSITMFTIALAPIISLPFTYHICSGYLEIARFQNASAEEKQFRLIQKNFLQVGVVNLILVLVALGISIFLNNESVMVVFIYTIPLLIIVLMQHWFLILNLTKLVDKLN